MSTGRRGPTHRDECVIHPKFGVVRRQTRPPSRQNQSVPETEKPQRHIGAMLIALVVGVVLGVAYLQLLHVALDILWTDIPKAIDNVTLNRIYTVVFLVVGASLVVWLRRSSGVFGHSPLDGLAVHVDPIRSSLISLAAVVISLFSGAVLGPEAGLIAMGTALGVWMSKLAKAGETEKEKLVKVAVLGAVIGLVVNMGAGGTINIVSVPLELAWMDFVWAIPVAIVSSLIIVAIRLPAYYLRDWGDARPPHVYRGAIVGLLIAIVAIIGIALSEADPRLILGSGEGYIEQVLAITSVSTIVIIIIAKGIAYSLCLGGGLRGGPIFPAMFIGGAVGAIFIQLGAGAEVNMLAASGVLAATCTGLKLNFKAMVIVAVVFGLLLGSPLLIPSCLIGMVIGDILRHLLSKVPGVGPVADEPDTVPTAATA